MDSKIVGKWYILDRYASTEKPVAGPFDSRGLAEAERRQLNNADECFAAMRIAPEPKSNRAARVRS